MLRIVRDKRQRLPEQLDTIPLRDGTKARVEDVVGPRHAFDNVAFQVRVDTICRDKDGVAGSENQIIHQQGSDQVAVVTFGVLLAEPVEKTRDVRVRAELRLWQRLELLDGGRDCFGGRAE